MTLNDKDLARFWGRVDKRAGEECWPWGGCRHRQGYGVFGLRRKLVLAHRVSKSLEINRPLTASEFVCHHCDNPPCVNPKHLFIGSRRDNITDMILKGRDGGLGVLNRAKSRCDHGHPFTDKNTYIVRGQRQCRVCLRAAAVRYRKRKKNMILGLKEPTDA